MKYAWMIVIISTLLSITGCSRDIPPSPNIQARPTHWSSPTPVKTASGMSAYTKTPTPAGRTIIVSNNLDNGSGTFRQALIDAQMGDTITFDQQIFPPEQPTTIFLENQGQGVALPEITHGNLTIDASNAGVILDGSKIQGDWVNCLHISSSGNVIRGLQIINFPDPRVTPHQHNRAGHNPPAQHPRKLSDRQVQARLHIPFDLIQSFWLG